MTLARAALFAALSLAACRAKPSIAPSPALGVRDALDERAAAPDLADAQCFDVGARRACWPRSGRPVLVERTVPDGAAPGGGWRCKHARDARTCAPRRATAGPFRCDGSRCEQQVLRLPDDGAWDCIDQHGASVCVGGERAAGLPQRAPVDPSWLCATRNGTARTRAPAHGTDSDASSARFTATERVCVDLSPDLPEPTDALWSCSFDARHGLARRCATRPRAASDACERDSDCPLAMLCVERVCLPREIPRGECWFDEDCGPGRRCSLATCVSP